MTYRLSDIYQVKETDSGAQIYTPLGQLSPEQADPSCETITLDQDSQWLLVVYLTDGLCPSCGEEIALNDVICDDCLSAAIAAR